jgi:hypothetical protein
MSSISRMLVNTRADRKWLKGPMFVRRISMIRSIQEIANKGIEKSVGPAASRLYSSYFVRSNGKKEECPPQGILCKNSIIMELSKTILLG